MRVSDILGTRSYFEAEAEYCLNMTNKAVNISGQNKRGLFLMDEPMHSTPPIEGVSVAYSVAKWRWLCMFMRIYAILDHLFP
jgi:DNA mismatch repair ATPase MutS